MKTLFKLVLTAGLVLSLCTPGYAYWRNLVAINQIKAIDYIATLKSGANPEQLEAPRLRTGGRTRAKLANREIRSAIRKAEELSRSGKSRLIQIPVFQFSPVSKERMMELRQELKNKPRSRGY